MIKKAGPELQRQLAFVLPTRMGLTSISVNELSTRRYQVAGAVAKDSAMKKSKSLYHGHRFPAGVIGCAVRWYFRFQLSLRDIEELLFERGVVGGSTRYALYALHGISAYTLLSPEKCDHLRFPVPTMVRALRAKLVELAARTPNMRACSKREFR